MALALQLGDHNNHHGPEPPGVMSEVTTALSPTRQVSCISMLAGYDGVQAHNKAAKTRRCWYAKRHILSRRNAMNYVRDDHARQLQY